MNKSIFCPGNELADLGCLHPALNADIQTSGEHADGIFAFHLGAGGTVDLTKYDQAVSVSREIVGTGPYELFEAEPAEPFPAANAEAEIHIEVEGGSIAACDDEEAEDREDCAGRGIAAEFGSAVQAGHAEVDITGAVVKGAYAVQLKGGRGTLSLTDSRLVGSVLFARGDYDDTLAIRQKARSGRIDGNIDFSLGAPPPGDDDQMTLDIARGQHFAFNGRIDGLETMIQRGGGWARFAEDAEFTGDSRLRLEDGYLVIAGLLNLGNGVLTVQDAGRLVFEAGQDSMGNLKHGQIIAGTLRFADVQQGSPAVALQLSENLSDEKARQVRRQLAAQAAGTDGLVLITIGSVTRGSGSEPVGSLVLRPDPDGAVRVGTIGAAPVAGRLPGGGRRQSGDRRCPDEPLRAAGGAVSLRQADRLGALSFNTPAGLRALPKAVHSLRLGADKVRIPQCNAE